MEHLPLFFLFDTPWPSQTSSQSSSRSHPALATLGFHPQYWERATSSVAWGHFLPSFWLHQWFQTFYHSLPFPGCERFSLSQVKVDIIIFSRNFLHFFKIFSFLYGFFFLPQQVKLSLSTQPWEPWTFLLQRTFPVAPYMQSWIPYLLLTLCFSLLFLLVWRFFFPGSSLAWLFTSVDASLLLATQPVLFLKRLLSTGVVKRQHLHSSTWCTVFFTLGSLLPAFHRICI